MPVKIVIEAGDHKELAMVMDLLRDRLAGNPVLVQPLAQRAATALAHSAAEQDAAMLLVREAQRAVPGPRADPPSVSVSSGPATASASVAPGGAVTASATVAPAQQELPAAAPPPPKPPAAPPAAEGDDDVYNRLNSLRAIVGEMRKRGLESRDKILERAVLLKEGGNSPVFNMIETADLKDRIVAACTALGIA